jgi:hypothetical protein
MRTSRAIVICALVVAGCSGSSKHATPTTSVATTASSVGSSTTTSAKGAPTSTSSSGATTTVRSVPPSRTCAASQLRLTSYSNSGTGHIIDILVFTNTSNTTCFVQGYPGVAGLDAHGKQVIQAERTTQGYVRALPAGQPIPVVTLAPGQAASATVEGDDVTRGTETSCPTYPSLLVTPPNTTTSIVVKLEMAGCVPVQVHPVVPGTTGERAS